MPKKIQKFWSQNFYIRKYLCSLAYEEADTPVASLGIKKRNNTGI